MLSIEQMPSILQHLFNKNFHLILKDFPLNSAQFISIVFNLSPPLSPPLLLLLYFKCISINLFYFYLISLNIILFFLLFFRFYGNFLLLLILVYFPLKLRSFSDFLSVYYKFLLFTEFSCKILQYFPCFFPYKFIKLS